MGLPVIDTPRLRLRPRAMQDLDACLALDRSPGTTRFIEGPWGDRRAHEAFVRARIRGPYPFGQGYWIITQATSPDHFLGWVMLIPEDARGPRTEIGWRIRPEVRGQGYAPEAAAHLLAHGFQTGVPRIIAGIHRDNTASRRVAEKIGMTLAEARGTDLLYAAALPCAAQRRREA